MHCNGQLFDGSHCNTDVVSCAACGVSGCSGDGCEFQGFLRTGECDNCGGRMASAQPQAA